MKNIEYGFTLIELLIVIAIVGILIAVVIPNLLGAKSKSIEISAAAYARRCLNNLAAFTINNPGVNLIGVRCINASIAPDTKPDYIIDSIVNQGNQGELYLEYKYRKNGQDYTASIPVNFLQ